MSVEKVIDLQIDWQRRMAQIYREDLECYLAAYHSQRETGHYIVEYRFTRNDDELRDAARPVPTRLTEYRIFAFGGLLQGNPDVSLTLLTYG